MTRTIPLPEAERIVRFYAPGGVEYEPIIAGTIRLMRDSAARAWRAGIVATCFGATATATPRSS
jgi:hypothetical protein